MCARLFLPQKKKMLDECTCRWETDTHYKVGDRVRVYKEWFTCIVAHKSKVFGNDLFDFKYWKRESASK